MPRLTRPVFQANHLLALLNKVARVIRGVDLQKIQGRFGPTRRRLGCPTGGLSSYPPLVCAETSVHMPGELA
eukprot:1947106-Amphidinium_carterae.1